MPSEQELQKIAKLAYLEMDDKDTEHLSHDLDAIMAFVEQLRPIDTSGVLPLFHPLDLQQRLRLDEAHEENCVEQLGKIAPLFAGDLYLVPKVIDSGK